MIISRCRIDAMAVAATGPSPESLDHIDGHEPSGSCDVSASCTRNATKSRSRSPTAGCSRSLLTWAASWQPARGPPPGLAWLLGLA